MKQDSLTFIVLSHQRGKIRQFRLSKSFISIVLLLIFFSLGFGAYGVYVRINTLKDRDRFQRLMADNALKRRRLMEISSEVGKLRDQLARLHQLDKKIRAIANLGHPQGEAEFPAVGGVSPGFGLRNELRREKAAKLSKDLRSEIAELRSEANRQEESLRRLKELLLKKQDMLARIPTIWPTRGWLASRFGYRISPFTGLREFHRGIDIAAREGTPIIAPADGFVLRIGKDRAFGLFVELDHGFGYTTFYGHLSKVVVRKGQRVRRGQIIAMMGNTGRSTGPHLHYEIHISGLPVNPLRFIIQ